MKVRDQITSDAAKAGFKIVTAQAMLNKINSSYAHLESKCSDNPVCADFCCSEMVKQREDGRWFITMGHAGFNCRLNNANGFSTQEMAIEISRLYLSK